MAYASIYPYTGKTLKTYNVISDDDLTAKLNQAEKVFQEFGKESVKDRAPILANVAKTMRQDEDQLAKYITHDMGKLLTEAKAEVELSANIAQYYADNGADFLRDKPLRTMAGNSWMEYDATGIVMCVEPWNFPYYQLMRVFATNFMLGNPVMVKHASNVPQCAEAFEKVIEKAGAPKGAYTNLFVNYKQVGRIIADPRVQGVALTGSEKAGAIISAEAGKNLKKCTMELGGNDVMYIRGDVNVKKAAKLAAYARLWNAGQVCVSAKRYIVAKSIYPEFMKDLKAEFAKYKPGDPMKASTNLAPLSSKKAQLNLQKQVKNAVANGAKMVFGGGIPKGTNGFFYNPTILTNITKKNPAFYQEFFGPVAQVYVAKDDAEAIKIANDSNYGLGGAIVSKDTHKAAQVASKMNTGMIYINDICNVIYPELPFGGVKHAGFGRELGPYAVKTFANAKLVSIKA
ncbi:NAD-dependent succinate-semialdehyde dehydrogenase [Acetilactobacillus jinshanensis]|uniref:NAD-dependent succinate-semialdehyde dehydrogenase n=1 Tax=Acetilactobacillus jinshanensis TaxID=1720083 RepID=A0A4P6ZKF8_9LACO|nr:NAD-dependent succinate-semialdehyde dehydrogenase [Acetilactobacillus jinshanensis]QBP18255.1 NAD-dependent succinate-semialdehyde dehydrogenase [Acetilactobacillus jinshanensis]URL61961.1 NAD-dependent succinate-semialdehyde dehydrogenase [uncultured bacterium]